MYTSFHSISQKADVFVNFCPTKCSSDYLSNLPSKRIPLDNDKTPALGHRTDLIRNTWDLFDLLQFHLIRLNSSAWCKDRWNDKSFCVVQFDKTLEMACSKIVLPYLPHKLTVLLQAYIMKHHHFMIDFRPNITWPTVNITPTFRRRYWRLPSCSHNQPNKVMEPLPSCRPSRRPMTEGNMGSISRILSRPSKVNDPTLIGTILGIPLEYCFFHHNTQLQRLDLVDGPIGEPEPKLPALTDGFTNDLGSKLTGPSDTLRGPTISRGTSKDFFWSPTFLGVFLWDLMT